VQSQNKHIFCLQNEIFSFFKKKKKDWHGNTNKKIQNDQQDGRAQEKGYNGILTIMAWEPEVIIQKQACLRRALSKSLSASLTRLGCRPDLPAHDSGYKRIRQARGGGLVKLLTGPSVIRYLNPIDVYSHLKPGLGNS
jgi:hypothetical protein